MTTTSRKSSALFASVLFAFCALPSCTSAQSACTRLAGAVTDSTQALIPGARLTLDGHTIRTSGADGQFVFPCVAAGHHSIVATADAFAPQTITVSVPHAASLNFRLLPSSAASITVSADDNAQVPAPGGTNGLIVSGKQLEALADDPDDLLRELQQLAAASGGNPANTTISVDGFQDAAKLPPKSSIAYINVAPDLFSAEYREPPFEGGRVEVYTKPGAKNFHGALFTTNSSSWMNARDPFTTSAQGTVGKQRYGFDLSGPIRKQGSNFSLSLEHRSIDELGIVNAITFDSAGNQVTTIDSVPQPQRLWIGQARADAQIGLKNIASLTYSSNYSTLANQSVGGETLREAGYEDTTNDQTVRFSLVTTMSPKLIHEARIAEEWYRETDIPNSTAPSVSVSGFFTGGGASIGNTRQFRTGLEYDDDFVRTSGNDTIKAGFQLFYKTRNSNLFTGFNGGYIFPDGQSYLAQAPEQFSNVTGNPNVIVHQLRLAAFYQQDVKLRPTLTLSYGLRYFLETDPATFGNFDPRLGVAWTPDKKKTVTVKAHFGIFSAQYGADDAEELHREDGVERVTSLIANPVYGTPFANATPIHAYRTLGSSTNPGTYAIGDASVSQDLPYGFNLNVDAVFARFLTYDRTVDINQPLTTNPYGPRPFGPNVDILQVQTNGTGQGNGVFLGLSNFKHKRAQFFLGALHLDIRDNTNDSLFFQPQSAYTDSGEDVRRTGNPLWQTFGNLNVTLPYKLSLAGNGYAQGQAPFNITTGADNNGDGNFNDRPQFAAPGSTANGVSIFHTPFGLLTNAGPIVNGIPTAPIQRNLGSLPWVFHLDLNLERAFVLTRNGKADHQQTLTANIRSANFINHTNVTGEGSVLGSPQFLAPISADTARRVEFGLRYSF
jgi:hypothetical protein